MRRILILCGLVLLTACPGDKKVARRADTLQTATVPVDSAPGDLSSLETSLPPAEPDTFKPRKLTAPRRVTSSSGGDVGLPEAPGPLMEAVQREQSFSRFCFQEFGQKSDPTLSGNVAMVVTVGAEGITDARVGDSNWSSRGAGGSVDRCLSQRARLAWKLSPGAVKPGRYVVQLSFRGS